MYTATQITKREEIELGAQKVQAFPGDWLISLDGRGIDLLNDVAFKDDYESTGPVDPLFTLTPQDQATLTEILGFGSTASSQSLTLAVQHLARLSIGDIPVNFTPGQWEQLARRAEKRGQPIAVYMQRLVDKLLQDLWTMAE